MEWMPSLHPLTDLLDGTKPHALGSTVVLAFTGTRRDRTTVESANDRSRPADARQLGRTRAPTGHCSCEDLLDDPVLSRVVALDNEAPSRDEDVECRLECWAKKCGSSNMDGSKP